MRVHTYSWCICSYAYEFIALFDLLASFYCFFFSKSQTVWVVLAACECVRVHVWCVKKLFERKHKFSIRFMAEVEFKFNCEKQWIIWVAWKVYLLATAVCRWKIHTYIYILIYMQTYICACIVVVVRIVWKMYCVNYKNLCVGAWMYVCMYVYLRTSASNWHSSGAST